jgi:hypothetical protein
MEDIPVSDLSSFIDFISKLPMVILCSLTTESLLMGNLWKLWNITQPRDPKSYTSVLKDKEGGVSPDGGGCKEQSLRILSISYEPTIYLLLLITTVRVPHVLLITNPKA